MVYYCIWRIEYDIVCDLIPVSSVCSAEKTSLD